MREGHDLGPAGRSGGLCDLCNAIRVRDPIFSLNAPVMPAAAPVPLRFNAQPEFAGDVRGTGYHAARPVKPGDSVAVLGLGPVGLCAVQTAFLAGAAQVVAVDTVEERLEMARRFGAVAVHLTEQSPRDEVKPMVDQA